MRWTNKAEKKGQLRHNITHINIFNVKAFYFTRRILIVYAWCMKSWHRIKGEEKKLKDGHYSDLHCKRQRIFDSYRRYCPLFWMRSIGFEWLFLSLFDYFFPISLISNLCCSVLGITFGSPLALLPLCNTFLCLSFSSSRALALSLYLSISLSLLLSFALFAFSASLLLLSAVLFAREYCSNSRCQLMAFVILYCLCRYFFLCWSSISYKRRDIGYNIVKGAI